MKKCPHCAELVQDDAVICRFCGYDLNTDIIEGTFIRRQPSKNKIFLFRFVVGLIFIIIIGSIYFLLTSTFKTPNVVSTRQSPVIYSTYISRTQVITSTTPPFLLGNTPQRLMALLNSEGIPFTDKLDHTNGVTINAQSLNGSLNIMAQFNGDDLITSQLVMKIIGDNANNTRNYAFFNQYYPILLPDWSDREQWMNTAGNDNNQKLKFGQDPAQFSTTNGGLKITLVSSKINQNLTLVIEKK